MVLPVMRRGLELRKRSALRRVPPDMDTFRTLTALNSYLLDGLEIVSYNSRGVSEFLAKHRFNRLTDTVAEGLGLSPLFCAALGHDATMIKKIIEAKADPNEQLSVSHPIATLSKDRTPLFGGRRPVRL